MEQRGKYLIVLALSTALNAALNADGLGPNPSTIPVVEREDGALFEVSPWVKAIDLVKSEGLLTVLVRASGPTECYRQREIERIFERNTLKIILRLRRPAEQSKCPAAIIDYEEKVFEGPIEQAPTHLWILGHEGWHKLKVHE